MKKGFITNKYTISVCILLAILAVDIILHKGMSRVILPETFTKFRAPQTGLLKCSNPLLNRGKQWQKAVNTTALAAALPASVNGVEMDVYFDSSANCFFVYHDSAHMSNLKLEEILSTMKERGIQASLWLDCKNLSMENAPAALGKLCHLRSRYALKNKVLVESPNITCLPSFCDSGFYTSYYTPFFNPYNEPEEVLAGRIDSISNLLKRYPVSALSGYYFQAPFLLKYFPEFPILTWADKAGMSVVGNLFTYKMEAQNNIHIVLYPAD